MPEAPNARTSTKVVRCFIVCSSFLRRLFCRSALPGGAPSTGLPASGEQNGLTVHSVRRNVVKAKSKQATQRYMMTYACCWKRAYGSLPVQRPDVSLTRRNNILSAATTRLAPSHGLRWSR